MTDHFHLRSDYPLPCFRCGETEGVSNSEVIHYRTLFALLERMRAGEDSADLARDYGMRLPFMRTLRRLLR